MALEIADQGAVAVVAPPREVVDANDPRLLLLLRSCTAANDAQQRIAADGQGQAPCEGSGGATAQGQAEVMDNLLEPTRAASEGWEDIVWKALGEDALWAGHHFAAEAPGEDRDVDASPAPWQVDGAALVAALHALRRRSARWAACRHRRRPHGQADVIAPDIEMFDEKAVRHELRRLEAAGHGAAPSRMSAQATSPSARVSQSQSCMPVHSGTPNRCEG